MFEPEQQASLQDSVGKPDIPLEEKFKGNRTAYMISKRYFGTSLVFSTVMDRR